MIKNAVYVVLLLSMMLVQSCGGKTPSKVFDPENPWAGNGPKPAPPPRVKEPAELGAVAIGFPEGSLIRSSNLPFETAWEKVSNAMMSYPLVATDKAGGMVFTDWMADEKRSDPGGMFSGGSGTVERFRFVVKVYDKNGASEVVVSQYAQRWKNNIWGSTPPRVSRTGDLMKELIAKLEK